MYKSISLIVSFVYAGLACADTQSPCLSYQTLKAGRIVFLQNQAAHAGKRHYALSMTDAADGYAGLKEVLAGGEPLIAVPDQSKPVYQIPDRAKRIHVFTAHRPLAAVPLQAAIVAHQPNRPIDKRNTGPIVQALTPETDQPGSIPPTDLLCYFTIELP
ncbi:hypothetical protein ACH518_06770 [Methylomonas sp. HW2-6]|uniref:hypothetical protein n=1 Tax=Methylomonas sp. HW2-6 TaxID=3376687 RepID=UPI004041B4CB